jgi:hypothetical protein
LPVFGKAHWFSFGHADEGELLAAGDEESVIGGPDNFEGTPEADFFNGIEATPDMDDVSEAGGFAIIGFGADEDGEFAALGHLGEGEAEFGAETGAGGLDKAEVSEIMNDTAGIRIKEHDLFFRLYSGCWWHGG